MTYIETTGYGLRLSFRTRRGTWWRFSFVREGSDLFRYVRGPSTSGQERVDEKEEQGMRRRAERVMARAGFALVA